MARRPQLLPPPNVVSPGHDQDQMKPTFAQATDFPPHNLFSRQEIRSLETGCTEEFLDNVDVAISNITAIALLVWGAWIFKVVDPPHSIQLRWPIMRVQCSSPRPYFTYSSATFFGRVFFNTYLFPGSWLLGSFQSPNHDPHRRLRVEVEEAGHP